MLLPFSTIINNKPTYFVEKIWAGFALNQVDTSGVKLEHIDRAYYEAYGDSPFDYESDFKPKLHTIRRDNYDRWKSGVLIDYFINARKKNMFRFAPRVPVVSKQRIFMTYLPQCGLGFRVSINGRQLAEDEVEQLAFNDGFEAVEDFEDYFIAQMENDEYSGKIIHWTNLKY
ncbi:hypothetical protein [Elizabethkingia anophelis]|uniref:Uncharacterized protein n=1 Tax=Elizabethkingia anophelis TaxID=1117645 RepID=A0A455ZI11_9FLAO|nr:hypothetical protein [Elizabethkingia anophelis]AQW92951.1 hypothetical protein BBD30_01465 [Elizabethkingia anophelis]OPB61437.1 hypothetical protein BAS07_16795 [Elizabethkingia anophelis]DAC76406.1 TPA_exp: hypothetical protein [Elizabethkingia anophelis]